MDSCAGKLIRTNHRLMGTYVQLMPAMVQKRMQEMESKAAEVAKAEAAAAAQGGASAMTDTQSVIPAASPPVEILDTPQIASPLVFEPATQASETAKLATASPVTNNAQTFTTDSLQGQINVPPVMSTSSVSSSTAGVGSVSGPVAGAGQNSQTPS